MQKFKNKYYNIIRHQDSKFIRCDLLKTEQWAEMQRRPLSPTIIWSRVTIIISSLRPTIIIWMGEVAFRGWIMVEGCMIVHKVPSIVRPMVAEAPSYHRIHPPWLPRAPWKYRRGSFLHLQHLVEISDPLASIIRLVGIHPDPSAKQRRWRCPTATWKRERWVFRQLVVAVALGVQISVRRHTRSWMPRTRYSYLKNSERTCRAIRVHHLQGLIARKVMAAPSLSRWLKSRRRSIPITQTSSWATPTTQPCQ